MKERLCRGCKTKLPATRYFRCMKCQPETSSLNDDYIYDSPEFDNHLETMFEDQPKSKK